MSFRKEYKVRLNHYGSYQLKSKLYNLGMKKLYPTRKIHSLYFDSSKFISFYHSEEGVVPRKKIRIRSYPQLSRLPNYDDYFNLEIKFSSLEGRYKKSKKILRNYYNNLITNGFLDSSYGVCLPRVNVEYERSYFKLNEFRITFDKDIIFYDNKGSNMIRDFEQVLEIKCQKNITDDHILSFLHTQNVRFSKYERAMKSVYNI